MLSASPTAVILPQTMRHETTDSPAELLAS
jgi:hypothetical protein